MPISSLHVSPPVWISAELLLKYDINRLGEGERSMRADFLFDYEFISLAGEASIVRLPLVVGTVMFSLLARYRSSCRSQRA